MPPAVLEHAVTHDDGELPAGQQLHQPWHQAGLQHHLDALVGPVRQVGHRPAGVGQHLTIVVVQQPQQSGQQQAHRLQRRGRVLVPT